MEEKKKEKSIADKEQSLKTFLFNTQTFRKAPLGQYIFSLKVIVAFIIACVIIMKNGEKYFLYSAIGFTAFLLYSYRKDYTNFTFKITKASEKTYYGIYSKIIKKIFKDRKNRLFLSSAFSKILIDGIKKPKKGKR